MMIRLNRPWQEHEKYQLWLAYRTKTSPKIMEKLFKRTSTSINKYLSRSGIRQKVLAMGDQREMTLKIENVNDLERMLINFGLDNTTVGLEREHTRNWQPSKFTLSKLKEIEITLPHPWSNTPRQDNLPKLSAIGRSSFRRAWAYSSLQAAVNTLIRNGRCVVPYNLTNPYGHTYTIDDKRVTDFQLLLEANVIRLKNGHPIFLVEGVTYDG